MTLSWALGKPVFQMDKAKVRFLDTGDMIDRNTGTLCWIPR